MNTCLSPKSILSPGENIPVQSLIFIGKQQYFHKVQTHRWGGEQFLRLYTLMYKWMDDAINSAYTRGGVRDPKSRTLWMALRIFSIHFVLKKTLIVITGDMGFRNICLNGVTGATPWNELHFFFKIASR